MDLKLDRHSAVPLYKQIEDIIKNEIVSIGESDSIPITERALIERFKVSRAPVRQALKGLAEKGYLYRQRGLGTFPMRGLQLKPDALRLGGLTQYLRDQGIDAEYEVQELGRINPSEEIQRRLNLTSGTDVFHSDRIIDAHGTPLIWSRFYINVPAPFNPSLTDIEQAGGLFALLQDDPDRALVQGEHSVFADWAGTEEAKALGINCGDPVLVMDTKAFTRSGKLTGYRRLAHRPIDYKFTFSVTN